MEHFLQSVALVLLAVILSLVIGKQNREMSVLLSLGVCCLVFLAGGAFLEPVLEFLTEIRKLGNLDNQYLSILLKAAGIGLLAELSGLICSDAGEGAMGKAVQLLSNAAVLWISLPLFKQLLALLEEVLGQV